MGDLYPVSDSDESIELSNEHAKQVLNNISSFSLSADVMNKKETTPNLVIIEQPQTRGFRFRYKCEGPSHGGLQGANSKKSKKTYPTVQILNYSGPALFVISLVTDDPKPHIHAHELVGKSCSNGICTIQVPSAKNPVCKMQNIGVMHVTRRKVADILKERILESMVLKKRIDSGNVNDTNINFDANDTKKAGEKAKAQAKDMSLNVVRLSFQAYLYSNEDNKFSISLPAVISNPIFDSKSLQAANLKIIRLDKYSGCCTGHEEVFLLCDRIQKNDISVVFSEKENSPEQWRAFANFGLTDVHKQYAIVFKTPPYHNVHITEPKQVNIRLEKPSNNEKSEAIIFTYYPKCPDDNEINIKQNKLLIHTNGQQTSSSEDDNPEDANSHEHSFIMHQANGSVEQPGQHNNSQHCLSLNSLKYSDVQVYMGKNTVCANAVKKEEKINAVNLASEIDSFHTESSYNENNSEYKFEESLQSLRNYVKTGNTEELLIHHRQLLGIPDNNGNNLLQLAVINNQVEVVKQLLTILETIPHDLNWRNCNSQTCLHLAVKLNQKLMVRLLLDYGADQSLVDLDGNNPLHLAIIFNNMTCLKELLWPMKNETWNSKISLCLKTHNDDGATPMNIADNAKNIEAINILKNIEANGSLFEDISMKIKKDSCLMFEENNPFEAIQERAFCQGDMYKMTAEIRTKLSSLLDSESMMMNWRDLALHLDLQYIIDEASRFESPTKAVLDIFETHGGYIQDIYEGLCSMKRLDAAVILSEARI